MADFENKIYELKNLIPEEGIGYALEELKLLMPKSASKFNEIILLEGRLKELTRDKRRGILSYEEYKLEYNQISNDVISFVDGLTVEDFQTKVERKAKKKNQGKLLHRIPNQMQLHKRTKCIVRLAFTEEDLLEDIDITEDTVIKSVRIAEVMEVILRDDNPEKAFEITTPNNKEQFLDEDYYTEWVFYAKPIIPGEHSLTLVISVLEEVRGKERRRDVVLEEMVTIVTEEPITDEMFKPSGVVLNNTSTAPIPKKTIGQQVRRYTGVFALLILGSVATWAITTESGQWQLAKLFNTEKSYDRYINKNTKNIEDNKDERIEEARWRKAKIIDTEGSYTEYLDESVLLKYEQEANERLGELIYQRLFAASQNDTAILKEFIKDFPRNTHINEVLDTLVTVEYEQSITTATPENVEPLLTFIQEYQNIERPQNKKLQEQAKQEYERLTGSLFNNETQPEIEVEPFEIEIPVEIETVEENPNRTTTEEPEVTPETPTENTTSTKDKTEEATKPKPEKATNPLDIVTVSIKGGSFMMGNEKGEDDEKPVRSVQISSFSMSKYEITQEQWTAIMGDNPSESKGCETCPVDNVSWNDVQVYLKKLNQKTGQNYRLPTEAEWEFAAKGGTKSKNYKYAGSNNIANVAWYYLGNDNDNTQPVGKKAPNELGLYDMTGNVWEWCSDWYDRTYYEKGNNNNPKGPKTGKQKVLRGGSLINRAQPCSISNRYYSYANAKKRHIGFRVVLD